MANDQHTDFRRRPIPTSGTWKPKFGFGSFLLLSPLLCSFFTKPFLGRQQTKSRSDIPTRQHGTDTQTHTQNTVIKTNDTIRMTRGPALCYTLLSVPINENEILKSGPKCEQSHRGRRTVGKWSSGEGRCFMASNHAIFIPYHLWWYTIVVFIRTLLGRAPQPPHESNSFSSLLLLCTAMLLHTFTPFTRFELVRVWNSSVRRYSFFGGILFYL